MFASEQTLGMKACNLVTGIEANAVANRLCPAQLALCRDLAVTG
jgi:hypothetical protein